MVRRINVREIEARDIEEIADYWLLSDPDHLVGMGVDLDKMPLRDDLRKMLLSQVVLPIEKKMSYALIWEIDGKAVGHCNVNQIRYEISAFMHLHLWDQNVRGEGFGTAFLKQSLAFFFNNLKLQKLYCEPYALNPAPNKILKKIGFSWEKKHTTIPGYLNFRQEVNRWRFTKEDFQKMS